jgi:hypothetical protein
MSRWNWLSDRPRRLKSGTLPELLQDLAYCQQREQMATLKSHIKAWHGRREEAEAAIVERFGAESLNRQ